MPTNSANLLNTVLSLAVLLVPFAGLVQMARVRRKILGTALTASAFAAGAALSLLSHFKIFDGSSFDGGLAVMASAGFWGGLAGGLPALALGAAIRLAANGPEALPQVAQLAAAFACGLALSISKKNDRHGSRTARLLALGPPAALAALAIGALLEPAAYRSAAWRALPILLAAHSAATALLGLALRHVMGAGQRRALHEAIIASARDALLVMDRDGLVEANQRATELLDADRKELIGSSLGRFFPPAQPDGSPSAEKARAYLERARSGESFSFRWEFVSLAGRAFQAEVSLFSVDLGDASFTGAYIRDISLKKTQEGLLAISESVFEASDESILVTDAEGSITYVNPAFIAMSGHPREDLIGRNPRILKSDRHDAAFYAGMWKSIIADGHWEGDVWNRRRNGETFPCRARIVALRDEEDGVLRYVGLLRDMTELARRDVEIVFRRNRDPLTGFHNREGFMTILDRDLEGIGPKRRIVLMSLDVSGFRVVNNGFGHKAGDGVLEELAARIRTLAREGLEFARLGGDEFLIELIDDARGYSIYSLWEALNGCFARPFEVPGSEVSLAMCLGIAAGKPGDSGIQLLKRAEIALEHAKQRGKGSYAFYQEGMERRAVDRLLMSRKLKEAIESGSIYVVYQPKIDFSTGEVSGLEALARWRDPELGPISPASFIPLAEETGLIVSLGEKVLAMVLADMGELYGRRGLKVAVNLSVKQFKDAGVAEEFARTCREAGVDPRGIELEITESVFIDDLDEVAQTCRGLKAAGFDIALDDFGTGYSSLTYLSNLPFDTLKLDKGFVIDIEQDGRKRAMLDAIVSLSKALSIRTVVEGVERPSQEVLLTELGCDYGQGYLYSEPLPLSDALAFIDARSPGGKGPNRAKET
jgi:diguanylate cyclase (GGDEF)-like protein/PAS domain S-box-containing protein